MKTKHFLKEMDHERIQAAIERTEERTSSDIVVYITHKPAPDPLAAATEIFARRHQAGKAQDDSLLLFFSPPSRTYAVVGGRALHEKFGQDWWDEISGILRAHFRTRYFCEGIESAIKFARKALWEHFPADRADRTGQADIIEE